MLMTVKKTADNYSFNDPPNWLFWIRCTLQTIKGNDDLRTLYRAMDHFAGPFPGFDMAASPELRYETNSPL
jgi:hypothetical protein